MIQRRVLSEDEAKAALAERRRLARVEAERQAELERQRIEEERQHQLKLQAEEEERQRQFELEAIRLVEEQRQAEEKRLQQAIEEARQREEAERERKGTDELKFTKAIHFQWNFFLTKIINGFECDHTQLKKRNNVWNVKNKKRKRARKPKNRESRWPNDLRKKKKNERNVVSVLKPLCHVHEQKLPATIQQPTLQIRYKFRI